MTIKVSELYCPVCEEQTLTYDADDYPIPVFVCSVCGAVSTFKLVCEENNCTKSDIDLTSDEDETSDDSDSESDDDSEETSD